MHPSKSQICLCCLEECNMPVSPHDLKSILMSCNQNIQVAHSTIINDEIHKMHMDLSQWAETCLSEIQNKTIDALVNRSIDQKALNDDD
jgi:hypothetical protein